MDEVSVWECVACEGRGQTAETVRHVITCTEPGELRELRFELGGGPAKPLFQTRIGRCLVTPGVSSRANIRRRN